MRKLTAIVAALMMVLAMSPVNLLAATPALTGGVRGTIIENSGRPLPPGLQARLVNSQGNTVPGMTIAVAQDGMYAFNNVAPGVYTVQVIGATGMSAVTVTADKVSTANVSVATAPWKQGGGRSTTAKWLIAAALIGGVTIVAVVATKGDASGSK